MTKKIYQPIVIERAEDFINTLTHAKFFEEYGIRNSEFATEYVCDKLTEKFIEGNIHGEFTEIFTEDEFDSLLKNIIVESTLCELKKKGYINSYIDDNGNENFFLTKLSKSRYKDHL